MTNVALRLCRATLVATTLASASLAAAGPSPASTEMQTALAKAEQGPDELRRFVNRTRMIYALDYVEVARLSEVAQAAKATPAAGIAKVADR